MDEFPDDPYFLSAEEKSLLQRHGRFYVALASGYLPPTTAAQKHFVEVAHCRAQAQTLHETAFAKRLLINAHRKLKNRKPLSLPDKEERGWW